MGNRTQAQRDAVTIEIGYALFSAFVLALATFSALTVPPAVFFDPSATLTKALLIAGAVLGGLVFVARVVHVLWGYRGAPGTQPSQPGRTSPDS
ncbi:DUF6332 family protein [Streptomyces sp. NPDC021093]|uniref:DUF6332 family protein n=1 Tax=Streptomyces sp. NPDC021093 TaxID=3365112 RepID=UPI0037AD9D57